MGDSLWRLIAPVKVFLLIMLTSDIARENSGLRGVSKWVNQGAVEKREKIIPSREVNLCLIEVTPCSRQ